MNDFNYYQKVALGTVLDTEDDFKNLMAFVLGLGGEAGEVLEKVKKIVRDKDGVLSEDDKREIAKELGDVLWYVAVLADHLQFDLDEIAEMNIKKLQSRQERDVLGGKGDNR